MADVIAQRDRELGNFVSAPALAGGEVTPPLPTGTSSRQAIARTRREFGAWLGTNR